MQGSTQNSALYEGWVAHARLAPKKHAFRYRVFSMLLDLDELSSLDRGLNLFGWNRRRVFSFYDRDHGDGRPLRDWIDAKLSEAGIEAKGARRVLCYPRLFGYVFNPLSVWFCYDSADALAAVIYEVHNTYEERHCYVLPAAGANGALNHSAAKAFYVSPFLSQDCRYKFRIKPPGRDVAVVIDEEEHGAPILTATFAGRRKPFDDRTLLSALLRYPLMTLKVTAAIHFEAVRLMWKGVRRHPHVPLGETEIITG